jgi:electron transfer flavoprotein alpha subunit
MRIAALVKQIPQFEAMTLGPDGRLVREGLDVEMNAYCRRAVAKAVELVREHGGEVVVCTLGPHAADDVLREAIAWGDAHGLAPEQIRGVHVCDTAFAGSDTLATARALHAALAREGAFDLVLCGRNSVDADTGQVGPELAELLDQPFVTAARHLTVEPDTGAVHARSEGDDGFAQLRTMLPAVVSCAERLTDPSKVDPEGRAAVDAARIRRVGASDLDGDTWGAAASPTSVGPVRVLEHTRARLSWPERPLIEQVARAVQVLHERGAFDAGADRDAMHAPVGGPHELDGAAVVAVIEPDRERLTAELLSAAAGLATEIGGHAVAFAPTDGESPERLGACGADLVVTHDATIEDDVARALATWSSAHTPWAVLAPSTTWGREVAARAAARLDAGLTGDAVELKVGNDGRLVAWKPAFGGAIVAAIHCRSAVQMATVRAGTLRAGAPRAHQPDIHAHPTANRSRIEVLARARDDDLDTLADADAVIAVGQGVDPARYDELAPLRRALGAELGATRKVTDLGWLPRARQIGITGRSVAPRLLVSIGAGGKFNHSIGFRNAANVLAVNPKSTAPIFDFADVGIIASWDDALPLLLGELERVLGSAPARA